MQHVQYVLACVIVGVWLTADLQFVICRGMKDFLSQIERHLTENDSVC